MILKKISIKNFGKLKNLNIELVNGLNIIYGRNESGKSTILGFIKGIFYGLRDKSNSQQLSELDKFQPWSGEEYTGMLEYEVNGKIYKVGRNFNTNKVSICNEFWDDITDKFPKDKKKGSLFANEHLGFSQESFEKTILIKQLESRVQGYNKELIDKIVNIQQTGSEEVSYTDAINLLENTQKDKIGSSKTKRKPLNLIDEEIKELEKVRNEINIVRNEVYDIEEKIKLKTEEKDEIAQQINLKKQSKNSFKKQQLVEKYNKAKEYETDLEDVQNQIIRLEEYKDFPIELKEKFNELLLQIKNNENILENKKKDLSELELKMSNMSNDFSTDSKDIINEIKVNLGVLRQTLKEKDDLTSKISNLSKFINECSNITNDKLENNNENLQEFQSKLILIQNKINQINDIKSKIIILNEGSKDIEINLQSDNNELLTISMKNIQDATEKYKNIVKYNSLIEETEAQINTIKEKIDGIKKMVEDFEYFKQNSSNINNRIDKFFNSNNGKTSIYSEWAKKRNNKKLIYSICSFSLVILLLLYSFYSILTSFSLLSYVTIALSIFFGLIGIFNLTDQLRESSVESKFEDNELSEMLQRIKVKNYSEFEEYTNNYNSAYQDISILEDSLKDNNLKLVQIKQKLSLEIGQISKLFDLFGVKYNEQKISKNDILSLKKIFTTKIQESSKPEIINSFNELERDTNELLNRIEQISECENVHYDDIETIINNFEEEKQKIMYIVNEFIANSKEIKQFNQSVNIQNDIQVKKKEIEYLKDNFIKLENNIQSIYQDIKNSCQKLNAKFDISEMVDISSINLLENNLNGIDESSSEISSQRIIKENIVSDISKFEELKENLQNQKIAILASASAQNEEQFNESCKNYYKYYQLFEDKNRIEKMYNELFEGKNSEEILKEISSIQGSNEVDNINISLDQIDIEIETLNDRLIQADKDIIQYESEISNKLNGKMNINEITEKLEELKNQKRELEFKSNAISVAVDVIKEVAQKIQKDFSPRFQNEMSLIVDKITNGKYTAVRANEALNLNVINSSNGQIIPVDSLSQGTIDQLYLGLRIALSNLLSSSESKLPLIIDEAFVQYDDLRVKNVLEFLLNESKERQIIIFTCQNREIEIINSIADKNEFKFFELA